MGINQRDGIEFCPAPLLLLSHLLTKHPEKEWVLAMELDFRGDEGEEFSKLLRIPYGQFVPPFLAAYQKAMAPNKYISMLLEMYLDEGFKFEQSAAERPDHVGIVLEFLALLESEKKNPSDKLQAMIADPIKQFAQALRKATKHPLYQKVADMLADMVNTEEETDGQG
jgi:TorA maturation chaperone TorD